MIQLPHNEFFADCLAAHGERIALVTEAGEAITYARLAQLALRAAEDLPAAPALIALAMANDLDSVVAYLAALRGRHPVILLDGRDTPSGRRVSEAWRPWWPGDLPPYPRALHPELAVLLSTSGSTGSPKLVRLSRRNIDANARAIASYLEIGAGERAITSLPLHYSYGLSVLNSHLAAGATVALTTASPAEPRFWEQVEAVGATSIAGVPHSYEIFERLGVRDRALPSLRTMTQAGGRLAPELVRRYAGWAEARGGRFFVMYGQTEATARMAYLPPELAATHPDCIGVPIPGGRFEIAATEVETRPGVGELVYRGPNVMMGYAAEEADLALPPALDALHTGDLAEQTAAGLFRIVGRQNRFSKMFGLRISHDEVERLIGAEGVAAAVTGSDRLLAVHSAAPPPAGAASRLRERLGLPSGALIWSHGRDMPHLPSGKPDYGAILDAAEREAAAHEARADGSVAGVFAAAFPDRDVAATDSFISLGGDSLNYVTFAIALEDVLGELPMGWERMSQARLMDLAEARPAASRKAWRWIDTDIVLRAAAICGVVLLHTGINRPGALAYAGGATLLMALFGYNLARFQSARLIAGGGMALLADTFRRLMLPYFAIVFAYSLYKHAPETDALLLISNYTGRIGNGIAPYWFLEALFQCVAFVVLLFAIPKVRAMAAASPPLFALSLVIGALALRALGHLVLDEAALTNRTFEANFVYVALGWMAWIFRAPLPRLVILAAAMLVTAADWGALSTHMAWIAAGLGLLLFLPRLPLPRLLGAPITAVADASFYVYIIHIAVIHLVEMVLHLYAPFATLALALVAGIALSRAMRATERVRHWGSARGSAVKAP